MFTMENNNSILSLTSGLLLALSFLALLGFVKPFQNVWAVIWELFFALSITYFIFSSSKNKLFRLSFFYAFNLVIIIIVNLFNKSTVSLAFFTIATILMSFGFVLAINQIRPSKKSLSEKSIKELKDDVESAFDNIEASNIKIEKYFDKKDNETNVKKVVKKSVKKKTSKKKTVKKKAKKKTSKK